MCPFVDWLLCFVFVNWDRKSVVQRLHRTATARSVVLTSRNEIEWRLEGMVGQGWNGGKD